jgi:hypothetical protein
MHLAMAVKVMINLDQYFGYPSRIVGKIVKLAT